MYSCNLYAHPANPQDLRSVGVLVHYSDIAQHRQLFGFWSMFWPAERTAACVSSVDPSRGYACHPSILCEPNRPTPATMPILPSHLPTAVVRSLEFLRLEIGPRSQPCPLLPLSRCNVTGAQLAELRCSLSAISLSRRRAEGVCYTRLPRMGVHSAT